MKKILLKVSLIALFLFPQLSCTQIKSKPITEFSQKDIKNIVLVDVRAPEEFAGGHLENAININWFDEDFSAQFDAMDKTKTIYVYCKKGGRSAKAAKLLDSLGYTVVDLLGGFDVLKIDH